MVSPLLLPVYLLVTCNAAISSTLITVSGNSTDTLHTSKQNASKFTIGFVNSDTLPLTVCFYSLNGINFSSSSKMIETMLANAAADKEKAFAIWKLCSVSGFHYAFPYESNLLDNQHPRALVNFPYFMCGEKAGILSNIAKASGLNSRVVSLNGHIVAEIYYDKKWHMFDADENVIFLDSKHEVLSVEELAKDPAGNILKEKSIILPNNHFTGYKHYRKYMKTYSVDSGLLHTLPYNNQHTDWTMHVRLNEYDTLYYSCSKTSAYTRFIQPSYKYCTLGEIVRHLGSPSATVMQQGEAVFIINEQLPYYVKRVSVVVPYSGKYKLEFIAVSRVSGDTIALPFNSKTKKMPLDFIEFNAPADTNIYYQYQLRITGLTEKQVKKLNVRTTFDFNSVTFPFLQPTPVVVESSVKQ
ncbi:MAG: hypothetical protein KIS94_00765 [Chitinophagales bacterium]|nr:hypothetical protein [Chitinophagales bacterium]